MSTFETKSCRSMVRIVPSSYTAVHPEYVVRPKPPIVYVDGIFDMFHEGHVEFLKKALAVGGDGAVLFAGVITDKDAGWKRRPIMTQSERAAVVRACRHTTMTITDPPLVVTNEFLDQYGITHVVHGDDDRQEKYFAAPIARGCMHYVPYHKGVSTSEIIERVRERHSSATNAKPEQCGSAIYHDGHEWHYSSMCNTLGDLSRQQACYQCVKCRETFIHDMEDIPDVCQALMVGSPGACTIEM